MSLQGKRDPCAKHSCQITGCGAVVPRDKTTTAVAASGTDSASNCNSNGRHCTDRVKQETQTDGNINYSRNGHFRESGNGSERESRRSNHMQRQTKKGDKERASERASERERERETRRAGRRQRDRNM